MGKKLLECVPNFSEGRRPEVIEAIVEAFRNRPGCTLFDYRADPDHNRLVVSLVGEPEPVEKALLEAAETARAADPAAVATPPPLPNESAAGGEKQDYDAALAVFRAGDFKGAQTGFANFIKRYPRSSLAPSALFWLGDAQYATRDYKEAITNFRSLLTASPNHQRAPEAMLSIANCQIELKDTRAARSTLESLVKTYPQSEAAQAGKERLSRLK